jgi:hypothetical protein
MALEWVVLAAMAWGVWVASLSAWSDADAVVAAAAASVCAALGVGLRAALRWPDLRPTRHLAAAAWRIPAALLTDTAHLLAQSLRGGPRGTVRDVPAPHRTPGEEAGAILLASTTPGSYLLDAERGLRLHVIGAPSGPVRALNETTGGG